tara:strand:+ start:54 stop:269 length:216 start_codon:yes stop_codon:yes gene_type:complete
LISKFGNAIDKFLFIKFFDLTSGPNKIKIFSDKIEEYLKPIILNMEKRNIIKINCKKYLKLVIYFILDEIN